MLTKQAALAPYIMARCFYSLHCLLRVRIQQAILNDMTIAPSVHLSVRLP